MNKPRTKHKYNAIRTEVNHISFPSKKEARRYGELKMLQSAGEIVFFLRQPLFDLPGGTTYRADFIIFWTSGDVTIEDVKGKMTEAFIKAKKQVEALYPVNIEVV